jgi:hypothetical protein
MDYLEEGVKNELNVSQLYSIFYTYCPEDHKFWWDLSMEEVNHASLLRSAKEFYKAGYFPFEISNEDIKEIVDLNDMFPSIIEDFKNNPSRKKAFEIAIKLENSVGEMHYQKFMTNDNDDKITKIFKKLNKDDKNHEERIRKYMIENNI